jgi:hypothetical protein
MWRRLSHARVVHVTGGRGAVFEGMWEEPRLLPGGFRAIRGFRPLAAAALAQKKVGEGFAWRVLRFSWIPARRRAIQGIPLANVVDMRRHFSESWLNQNWQNTYWWWK